MERSKIEDALLGIAVGDALGVPVEFIPRKGLINEPVQDMRGYGTHGQPPGTWSDDSALTFCLAEMLCLGYDLKDLANRFVQWKEGGYWSAHNNVFDIGIATSAAIYQLQKGVLPTLAGGDDEFSNGNGSLMRILPLAFFLRKENIETRFRLVQEISSLTHRHIRAVLGCFIYLEFALQLLEGKDKLDAFHNMVATVNTFLKGKEICELQEIDKFHRILRNQVHDYEPQFIDHAEEDDIYSSGYILHTLEASIWCILKTDNYKDAVLKAVNLGHDTDTTGAVTGGLAGILYGKESIPHEWLDVLARRKDIEDLAARLTPKLITR